MYTENEIIKQSVQPTHRTDAHLDLAFDIEKQRRCGASHILDSDYYPSFKAGGITLVVSSIYIESTFLPEMGLRMAMRQVSALKTDISECSDHFVFCTSYAETVKANATGRIAIMLSFEDCLPIYDDLMLLPVFYELGVRFMGLSWSRRNFACDGAFLTQREHGIPGGLTAFGIELVHRCEQLGIILDVSHINDAGFSDLVKYSSGPIIASHSNSRAIVNLERNLSDRQIRIVSSRNGFIGVNAMNFLVSNEGFSETLSALADHIIHIADIGGIECVGFGFDLNDKILKYVPEHELKSTPRRYFDVLDTHAAIPHLIAELERRGLTHDELCMVAGENYMRLLRDNL